MMNEAIPIMDPIFGLLQATEALGEWSDDPDDVWFVALAAANRLDAWLHQNGFDLRLVRKEDDEGFPAWELVIGGTEGGVDE
jgi:hypothetical protein